MPHLLRERDKLLTAMSLGDMAEPEKVAAGLRVQSLANEIAESYARISVPGPAAACGRGLLDVIHSREGPALSGRP